MDIFWNHTLGGDVKRLVLSPIEGDVKEPTLLSNKSTGSFPGAVAYLSCITHHSYHRLWVDYSKLINGLIVAATGTLEY